MSAFMEIISPTGAVSLSTVQASNAAFLESVTEPIVGVFVGGNSGVSEYALRALVSTTASVSKKKGHAPDLRLYIVGRNAKAADAIISDCRKLVPSAKLTFVKAEDLSLIKDVDRVCNEIVSMEKAESPNTTPRIDLLYMSQGGIITGVRHDTTEGLDQLMALMYYSRIRFAINLLPLLLESKLPSAAHIVSIYAAGMEDKLWTEDLSLRQPGHFDYNTARSHMVYMKALFMDKLATRYPGKISFCHVFPGLVSTPGFKNPDLPLWFKLLFPIIGRPLIWLIGLPAQEAGARMLYLATPKFAARGAAGGDDQVAEGFDGKPGSGVYSVWHKSNIKGVREAYEKIQKDELREKVWAHTNKAFDEIAAGRVFTE
ncbi:hypothetical protein LTR10_018813 [Elasticomyces elasticus]|uniref:Ketoreductase (KR) domain-containing protein n=1 Tax=Exophiala sideris TaxID=1016849 RepID=A0ABR0J805_9EURO|nr:hypothetical protein LTR10_018813 [Elasticomyces elasticus]KAK5029940.1 hypothetical protein LTS07_005664 [Exophiala sideris]KAK5031620.1 hypothetical protein LTR13_007609 [Exophiala sideris]KAK5058298.1 hypothetical protein LTR69_006702 [Exophiala sideris]KAK5180227.1 hypothetical protein LTR44_007352 [Eurotiomycetes sp. CCFEE 6388]